MMSLLQFGAVLQSPKLTVVMVPRRQKRLADALGGVGDLHMEGLLVLEWGRRKFCFLLQFSHEVQILKDFPGLERGCN